MSAFYLDSGLRRGEGAGRSKQRISFRNHRECPFEVRLWCGALVIRGYMDAGDEIGNARCVVRNI